MKKGILYSRSAQKTKVLEENESIPYQEQVMNDYALQNHLNVVGIYSDMDILVFLWKDQLC